MKTVNEDFDYRIKTLKGEYGSEFAFINGLAEEQISPFEFMDRYLGSKNNANVSVDPSANVKSHDVASLVNEIEKPTLKLLSFNKIYSEAEEMFGKEFADEWLELEWSKALYMHDSDTASLKPYCFAYDIDRMVREGLFWLEEDENMVILPAKHLSTFVDFIKEFIAFVANRSSGACGLPSLIPYMTWYWLNDVKNGEYPRNKTPEEYAKSQIQRFIYAINQPVVRNSGAQSAFVNTSILDTEYSMSLFGGLEFPDGTLFVDIFDEYMQFQKWFMEEMSAIKDRGCFFTFPVNTISLLKKDGKFSDEEFARWACEHNRKWNDSNFFVSEDVTSLSNCCRLKSNIQSLGYFNSIGGTALKVGSIKVSTINLARIAYENNTEESYLDVLKWRTLIDLKILEVIRHIIKKNVSKGILPNFDDGLMDFEHLYNTVGLNGLYEALNKFGYIDFDEFGNASYSDDAIRFGSEIFQTVHEVISEFTQGKGYMANIEYIPAETCALKFKKADMILFPEEKFDSLPMYGNQYVPLGIKATMNERIRVASILDHYNDGGSILHLNLDAPLSSEKVAWDLLDYVTDEGVSYFAFTGKLSQCENNHIFYGDTCPECGQPKKYEFARIVGFYTKTESWSADRQKEFSMRKWDRL